MAKQKYLEAGKITSVHGIKGEVKVQPMCDSPEFLAEFDLLYYKSGTPVKIEYARANKNMVIMKIEGITTADEAQKLRGRVLYLDRNDVDLPQGCYFIQDLLGMTVKDNDSGEEYGVLTQVYATGANDVYEIRSQSGKEYLIPAIPDVIMKNDLDNNVMYIKPLDGLFDDGGKQD